MSESPRTVGLLRQVAMRLRIASLGRRFYWTFLIGCGLFAAALLVGRLCGVASDWLTPASLLTVPAAAILVPLIWHHRPTQVEAARAVDQHGGTKDLFLTMALIENSAGEYQALVARVAEQRAARIPASRVVPFRGARELAYAAMAALLIVGGFRFLPQFDPFGQVAAAGQVAGRRQQLEETKKATEVRAAQLKKEEPEGPLSEEAQKAIESLKAALNKMEPQNKEGNYKELVGQQKALGDKWRKLSAEKLKDLLSQNPQAQQFGAIDRDKLEKWTRELQEGSTKSLQQELEELKQDLQQLAKTDDPVKKAELEQKIKKRMKELSSFASDKVNSKPLAAALQRAMKQMEMAKMEGMGDKEAREAAEQSLDLAKAELERDAQSARDLKALEEALKAIQQAKQLNDKEKLDGELTDAMDSIADYVEFYAQLMAQLGLTESDGEGNEGGMGGRGQGNGGKAPEDESIETGFQAEQSRSAVTAGKVLLSVKTQGLSDRGDAQKEYRALVEKVKQGYSEAILQEQVPPGYHEGIKKYFDNLGQTDAGKK